MNTPITLHASGGQKPFRERLGGRSPLSGLPKAFINCPYRPYCPFRPYRPYRPYRPAPQP